MKMFVQVTSILDISQEKKTKKSQKCLHLRFKRDPKSHKLSLVCNQKSILLKIIFNITSNI